MAAFVLASAGGLTHGLALRGYHAWTRGASEVESQLVRPELLALDMALQAMSLAKSGTPRARQPANAPGVHVVSLSADEGDTLDVLAAVLGRLDELEAGVVVIDLPDLELAIGARHAAGQRLAAAIPSDGRAAIQAWAAAPEAAIAAISERRPVVLAYRTAFLSRGPSHVSRIDAGRWIGFREQTAIEVSAGAGTLLPVTVVTLPPAALLTRAHAAARYDLVDPDGRTRREPLVVANGPQESRVSLPTLALEAARLARSTEPADVLAGAPLTPDGFLLVDHRIRSKAWPASSFLALARAESFRGSVTVVGLPRREDRVSFPLAHASEPEISHAEHLASALGNLLRGAALRRPPGWDPPPANELWQGWGPIASVVAALLAGLLALTLPGYRPFRGEVGVVLAAAVCVVVPGLLWGAAAFALLSRGVWLDIFYPIATMGAVVLGTVTVDFVSGGAERRQLRGMVERVLPAAVAQRALRDPSFLELGGTQREITVLFSDIRGFTRFAETNPPELVVRVLREYQAEMVRAIRSHGGTVDKLMGDGTMAFFGAPQDDPEHARAAVRAGLAMIEALARLNEGWAASGIAPLSIGIGVHTGPAVVGNMGTPEMISYTAIGDTVNVASRLEGLTKETGATLLVGDVTFGRLGPAFSTREVGEVAVRGRNAAVVAYEVLPPARS